MDHRPHFNVSNGVHVLYQLLERLWVYAKHPTASNVSRFTVHALAILGYGYKNHFLRPTRDLPANKHVRHEPPRPSGGSQGMPLYHDKIRGGRE